MITDNPLNDAISEMNRLDAINDTIVHTCYMCTEMFEEAEQINSPSLFECYHYCPQCLQEVKVATN